MPLRLSLLVAAVALLIAGAGAAGANRGLPAAVHWSEDSLHEPGPVAGAYVVQQRGYFSITAQVHTRGLTPGHRYTVWWVVYNNPAACVDGCDLDDAAAAAETRINPAGIGVHYGGTFIAPPSGVFHTGTRILEGSVIGCQTVRPFASLCNPLIDAATAESTLFVHDQGPAAAGPAPAPAQSFSAGCKTYTRLGVVFTTYGPTGYDCRTSQVVHLP